MAHPAYHFDSLSADETAQLSQGLQGYFERLPLDHFIDGDYRRRRLSRFQGPCNALKHLPHNSFVQQKHYNHLYGNIQRDYEELEEGLIHDPSFLLLFKRMQDYFAMNPDRCIFGVHQIRISCQHDQCGEPAPEGVHQDGFDHLFIACVNRVGVSGAATNLYDDPKKEPLCSQILEPGMMAFVDDRRLYHYTTPIFPVKDVGHRDVFVITAAAINGQ